MYLINKNKLPAGYRWAQNFRPLAARIFAFGRRIAKE